MATIGKLVKGSLRSKLVDLIRLRGPMTVAEYMKIVLTNPESGFYMNDDVFGVKGHFTTSPEISQIFGEVLGAWIMQEWTRFKCPTPLKLVEFGPGRGTLMADITRTLKALGQDKPQVNFIELSPHLRKVQEGSFKNKGYQVRWFSGIESLESAAEKPAGFTAYIAHEFLDALPIHKFVRDPKTKKWRELLVDYDEKENLRFCISRQPSLSTRLLVPKDFQGDHIEVCPQAALELEKVAKRLNEAGSGCALVCDYGFEDEPEQSELTRLVPSKSDRDTFRAFKNHESWPPLRDPGDADLTADVDFGYLKRHLRDQATIFGPVTQRNFLLKCGLQARLDSLLSDTENEEQKEELSSGASMLVDSMGDRYKFMALFPKGSGKQFEGDPPAGFD